MQADARRTAGSRLSGGQGPQHSSSELQGGRREVTGALGDVGRVEMVPTTRRLIALLLPLPLPLPMHVGTGDAVSLFFSCQPRFRCRGKAGLRCRARECRRYFEDEGEQGDDLGRFPHTSALLRSGAAVPAWWWWWWTDRHWRVDLEVSSSSRVPSTTWPMLPPPPPRRTSVSRPAIGWTFLVHGWGGTSLAAVRDGWRNSPFIPPSSRLPTPSKQAHGLVACTSNKMGLARPIEYLGQQCCCGCGQSTSSTLECLHRDGPFEPWCLSQLVARMDRLAGHCRRPCPGTHCEPTSPRVPADPPPCLLSTRWDPGVVQPCWTPFPSPSPCCCHTTVEHAT